LLDLVVFSSIEFLNKVFNTAHHVVNSLLIDSVAKFFLKVVFAVVIQFDQEVRDIHSYIFKCLLDVKSFKVLAVFVFLDKLAEFLHLDRVFDQLALRFVVKLERVLKLAFFENLKDFGQLLFVLLDSRVD